MFKRQKLADGSPAAGPQESKSSSSGSSEGPAVMALPDGALGVSASEPQAVEAASPLAGALERAGKRTLALADRPPAAALALAPANPSGTKRRSTASRSSPLALANRPANSSLRGGAGGSGTKSKTSDSREVSQVDRKQRSPTGTLALANHAHRTGTHTAQPPAEGGSSSSRRRLQEDQLAIANQPGASSASGSLLGKRKRESTGSARGSPKNMRGSGSAQKAGGAGSDAPMLANHAASSNSPQVATVGKAHLSRSSSQNSQGGAAASPVGSGSEEGSDLSYEFKEGMLVVVREEKPMMVRHPETGEVIDISGKMGKILGRAATKENKETRWIVRMGDGTRWLIRNARLRPQQTFDATYQWQDLPPGYSVPGGADIRIDMSTGRKQVRLLPPQKKGSQEDHNEM